MSCKCQYDGIYEIADGWKKYAEGLEQKNADLTEKVAALEKELEELKNKNELDFWFGK